MMRSLYSGVSGLRTHQTRMDVIGNNIANVNTTAYKAKNITFSDMLYQTTQSATGPNAANGTAGTNPRQIGLGVKTGAINTSITTEGATQSTGNPFDLKLTGEAFFVVSDGTNQYFTRDGSFNVDAAGYLCMGSTGYIVQGWTNTDADTGAIIQDSVKPIQVMSEKNATYPAAYTTKATISGIIDGNDDNLLTTSGRLMNVQTLDNRGYEYNLKFGIKPIVEKTESTKNVTNTERLYELPASIKYEDISTCKFYSTASTASGTLQSTDEITAVGMPKKLLDALEEEAKKTRISYGQKETVSVKINKDFCDRYEIKVGEDLGEFSSLLGKTINVELSGDKGYVAYNAKGESLGVVEASAEILGQLYDGGIPPTSASSTTAFQLKNIVKNGILVTEKTYTDGTDTKYTYANTSDKGAMFADIKYSDISKLLAKDSFPETQAQYTTVEATTTEEVQEGLYTIELLGMTDSEGKEVNISNLSDTKYNVVYDTSNGKFKYVGMDGNTSFTLNLSAIDSKFSDVSFDMSNTSNVDNGGKSNIEGLRDDGRKVGTLTGVAIGTDGVITANYSNGMSKSIAQIAVATFANAMGLQNEGDNLYSATANSGEFNGVGVDIKASGTGYMTTGVLEMSNVDLSQQFTDMITTQRGFQANSRIITTSDTLLEELVNLKR